MYHCKSDTVSLKRDNDIVLSATSFTDVPITLAVMYGCTEKVMKDTTTWLKRCEQHLFHPFVLPMIFAEHERRRLFNSMDEKSTKLGTRILELKNRVQKDVGKDAKKDTDKDAGKGQIKQTMTQRDCDAIDLWRSMSSLKNGLESFHTELGSMRDHLHSVSELLPKHDAGSESLQTICDGPEIYIDARLREMMAEFRSKIRSCESLLGSMTLATQMV